MRPVPGYPGYYVTEDGQVYGPFGLRKQQRQPNGYMVVFTTRQPRNMLVHRAVAKAYLPAPRPGQTQVNHKDGDKANNRRTNLEWVTPRENNLHAERTGLHKPQLGSAHGQSKLIETDIPRIRELLAAGASAATVGRQFGVSRQAVNDIAARRTWSHVP